MAGWLPRVRKRGRVGDFPPAVGRLLLTTRSQLVARRFRKRTSDDERERDNNMKC